MSSTSSRGQLVFRSSLLHVWVTRGPFGRRTKSLCDSGIIDSPSVSGGVPRGCLCRVSQLTTGRGRFVIPFGTVCYPFCISAYQRCISYVSAVYQCRRIFAFLIRLYQGVSGMCFICISSVSVTWVPPTLIRCIRVYQECIRHVSGVYQEGCFFTR